MQIWSLLPCKFIVSLSVLDYVEKILRGEEGEEGRGKDHGENYSIKENAVFQDQLFYLIQSTLTEKMPTMIARHSTFPTPAAIHKQKPLCYDLFG